MQKLTAAVIFSCLIIIAETSSYAQEPPQVQTLLHQLQSAQKTDEAAEQLLKLGRSDSKAREYLALHLPAIVDKGPKDPAQPWINAVRLAGDLKIAEAAPALAKWIGLSSGGTTTLSQETRLEANAPGKALAQIGTPAIAALVSILNHGNLYERWNAVYALNLIGSPQAKTALRKHLEREPDSTVRGFIEKALAT
jgi:HEAT repeat protein